MSGVFIRPPRILLEGVIVFIMPWAVLMYFHLSEFPIYSDGILCPVKALATCFQPLGSGVDVLFRSKSFIKSTACVLGRVIFFNSNSPSSLQRIPEFNLICFKRRQARDFHVFGTVSITMDSILFHSFTDSFTAPVVDGFS